MRISVFPKGDLSALSDSRTMTVFEWITKAASLPADGLELYSGMFWQSDDDHLDAIGEALAAEGFEMPMLCTSPDFTHPDAAVRASEFDRQLEMMRITRHLGGAGASTRVLSGQKHPGVSREQGVEWVVDAYQRLLPVARELDITLGMENHYKDGSWAYVEFAQKGDVFREIVDAIDDRVHFGVQFDPSNAITAGMDSADFLDEVIDRVVTMQASDRFLAPGTSLDDLREGDGTIGYSPALQHGVIGRGLNDYPRIFRTLASAGYDGWISIEDGVNGMEEMHESVLFLREAREQYFGGSTAVRVENQERARAAAGLASLARPALENDPHTTGRKDAR
jgi:sugar phosphate isomerase/epimerase